MIEKRRWLEIDRDTFLEYLSIYGTDIDSWPDDLRIKADRALRSRTEIAELLEAEKVLDDALMQRGFEESAPGLSEKIIRKALKKEPADRKSVFESLKEIFTLIPLPSPALALPLILAIGIVAGYLYPAEIAVSEPEGVQIAELIYNDGGLYE